MMVSANQWLAEFRGAEARTAAPIVSMLWSSTARSRGWRLARRSLNSSCQRSTMTGSMVVENDFTSDAERSRIFE